MGGDASCAPFFLGWVRNGERKAESGDRLLGVSANGRIHLALTTDKSMRVGWSWALLLAVGCADSGIGVPDVVEFNQHVRPILSNSCLPCHGPDGAAREADLRLDIREIATAERDGVRAIVPGDADASELIRRIHHEDVDERMPPAESERTLSDYDRAILRQWIEDGAEYEPHWAYVAPTRPDVADVRGDDWVREPVDAFILAKLEASGVSANQEADRVTLIRRLSFDLTGLPPTPAEVEDFVDDQAPDAYDELVDRLLASPHYGERMAIDWLDQVRYADTNGYHSDEERPVYPYRDYVIDAFNENLPFDTFTREQLAGDLLPDATARQKVASGFNRLNQISAEGGAQPKEYRAKYNADRVRAVASVWMGATLGCAECHDHKFDPFRAKDFYSMAAFFADIQEEDVYLGRSAWDPFLLLPSEEQKAAIGAADARIASVASELKTATSTLEREQAAWEAVIRNEPIDWLPAMPTALESRDGTVLELLDDLSVLTSGPNPDEDTYTVRIPTELEQITGLRLEVMSDPSFRKGLSRENFFFALHELEVDVHAADGTSESVRFKTPRADKGKVAQAVDGNELTAWSHSELEKYAPTDRGVFPFAQPLDGGTGTELVIRLKQLGVAMVAKRTAIGRFRISLTTSSTPRLDAPVGVPELALKSRRPDVVAAYFRTIAPSLEAKRAQLAALHRERDRILAEVDRCLISVSVEPRTTRLLPRGSWMDETGEVVEPAVPDILPSLDTQGRRATRLDLANWLVAPEHPLTARVFVNRLWKLLYGRGLSRVLDDLGSQGGPPSHPELLDWLAVEFRESGWDVKHMVRILVRSSTYRQSSTPNPALIALDPENRLFARQTPARLDAEVVRDNALSLAGLLSPRIGGRSVKPYQPDGYWDHLNFPKRTYAADTGELQHRRGLYTHWQRSFLHPSLAAFDAPSREECVAERTVSNTPQQALTLLNDPSYVEAARAFAYRIWKEGGTTDAERVRWALRQAVSRKPSDAETGVLVELHRKHLDDFRADPDAASAFLGVGFTPVPADVEAPELAAWTSVARAILSLHETMTRS